MPVSTRRNQEQEALKTNPKKRVKISNGVNSPRQKEDSPKTSKRGKRLTGPLPPPRSKRLQRNVSFSTPSTYLLPATCHLVNGVILRINPVLRPKTSTIGPIWPRYSSAETSPLYSWLTVTDTMTSTTETASQPSELGVNFPKAILR
jgi:hypothetical protein